MRSPDSDINICSCAFQRFSMFILLQILIFAKSNKAVKFQEVVFKVERV